MNTFTNILQLFMQKVVSHAKINKDESMKILLYTFLAQNPVHIVYAIMAIQSGVEDLFAIVQRYFRC